MSYGLDISWPDKNNNIDSHIYNKLTINKNLNIGNNLNIKFNLTSEDLIIRNNGFFNSNINIDNYILNIKDVLKADNINLKNTKFTAMENTNARTINVRLQNNATGFKIGKNINVDGNLNIGLFSVGNNINCKENINIKNKTILKNNLNNDNTLDVNNSIHKNVFNITNALTLNNIYVLEDLNIKNNLNLTSLTIDDKIKIRKDLLILNGLVVLPDTNILDSYGSLAFNSNSFNIFANINNNSYILNDSKGVEDYSSITINNNNNILIQNNNENSLILSDNTLDFYYNTNIAGNLNYINNININDSAYINKNINIQNDVILNNGFVKLPITEYVTKGAIRFNNTSKLIQTADVSNTYNDLLFTDNNNTSIIRNSNSVSFNIKNNNIITINNNTFINNNVNFLNNLNVTHNINILNNLYTSNNINISNIPIQFYNGLLRTYNNNSNNFVSLTLEQLNSIYKNPISTYMFYKNNITDVYSTLQISNTINHNDALFENYNYYDCQIIHTDLYLSNIFINIINSSHDKLLTNTYYIQILKNNNVVDTIILDNIYDYTVNLKLKNILFYNKGEILKINIKSLYNLKNSSVILNFNGYKLIPINTKGTSNYITDQYVYFNNKTNFNVNIDFRNNVNVYNTLKNTNNITIKKLSIFTNNSTHFSSILNTNKLLDINNSFIISDNDTIGIGTEPINNYMINIYDNNTGLKITGNLNILDNNSNLICNNLEANTINILEDIKTKNIITNKLPVKDFNLQSNINCLQNLNVNVNVSSNKNLNISNVLNTNKLLINSYNSNTHNKFLSNSNNVYMYENNNNLSYILHNTNILPPNNINKYIYHTGIENTNINNLPITGNSENVIKLEKQIYIKDNGVSFFTRDFKNTFNINVSDNNQLNTNTSNENSNENSNQNSNENSKFLSINDENTIINCDLILNNININERMKILLYNIYGPKRPLFNYDFRNNYSIELYSFNNITNLYELYFQTNISNNIEIITKSNIIYTVLNNKPYFNSNLLNADIGYNINIDVLYFTEIILINDNIKTFYNNIKSFKANNNYMYDVNIYYQTNNIIYPIANINRNGIKNIYGLKTEIK